MRPTLGSRGLWSQLIASGTLLQDPAVTVRIAEEDERVPLSASPLNPLAAVHVLNRAGRHTPLDQFSSSGLDVGHDELQALQHPGGMLWIPVLRWIEQPDLGGVSWTMRTSSLIRVSRSTAKPSCSL
jgi:hypothetical protein